VSPAPRVRSFPPEAGAPHFTRWWSGLAVAALVAVSLVVHRADTDGEAEAEAEPEAPVTEPATR
jgi:hypothetical protein